MLRGRDETLALLETAVSGGAAVVLAGAPGSGRSALLRAVAAGRPDARLVAGLRTAAGSVPLLVGSWAAGRDLGRLTVPEAAEVLAGLPGPLLVDDGTDADPASAEALNLLVGRRPLVVVGTASPRAEIVEHLAAAGATVVEVPPLDPADAEAVAARLGAADPVAVARRSGGMPGLLVPLSRGARPPARLMTAVDHAVAALSPAAIEDLAVAGLLDHDLPLEELPGGAELASAAMVRRGAAGWALRHGLAAERARARLGTDGDAVEKLYTRAAGLARDPARAVELLEAAGDRDGAATAARAAAAVEPDPARRARLWDLVASITGDPAAALEAATAAVRAADGPGAAAYAAAAIKAGGATQPLAEAALRSAQAARLNGDEQAALAALTGISGAPGLAAEVGVERSRLQVATTWSPPPPAERGAAGLLVAGLAGALAAGPEGPAALAAAITAAEEEHDRDLELGGRAALVVALALTGEGDASSAEAAALAARAEETGARSWRDAPARLIGALAIHRQADPRPLLDLGAAPGPFGPPVTAHLAVALADVGRTGEAAALLETGPWPANPVAQALRWWAAAEAAYSAGRLRTALTAAGECLDVAPPGFPAAVAAALVAGRAAVEADQEPPDLPADLTFPGGAPAELESLRLEDAGELEAAAVAAGNAAGAWAGGNRRAELRCLWAAADLRLRAGTSAGRDGAVDALRRLDEVAVRLGLRPLSARARRSLRTAGVRLAGEESSGERRGPLSPRESEVLRLVGAGRSSAEIAAHLGVATSTVETQIKSAIRKLGATNRRHAAALLAETDRP